MRHFCLLLLLLVLAVSCASDDSGRTEYGQREYRDAAVEVLLTEPFCDLCDADDKDLLRSRSIMIKRVVELIDGANSRVDVAQFTFSVSEIADALLRAHERGVRVRLAMDAAQDKPGTRSQELQQAGLDVRFISGKPTNSHNGLQHAKFLLVDGTTLWTGSNNFSSTGTTINEENAIVLRASNQHPVVTGFQCHFQAIWNGNHEDAGACSNDRVAFAPSSAPRKMVRDRIRAAQRSVDVIMHHFTFGDLVKELRKAAERGVRVRVLLNENTREEHSGSVWTALIEAGGQLRYKQTNESLYQLLHHKMAIIDGQVLINGSGNWSGSGFFNNFENYVVWQRPDVLQPFRGLFARLWNWSRSADSIDSNRDAATQHWLTSGTFFGNLHAHFAAHDGVQALDDGNGAWQDEEGHTHEVPEAHVREAAAYAYQHARDEGGLDFLALSPHCRDDRQGEADANMTAQGFEFVRAAASEMTDDRFVALASMEWSTNSTGNHVGIIGASSVAKVERGRFDTLYGSWLPDRAWRGDRPLVMLNHPRTFRVHEGGEASR